MTAFAAWTELQSSSGLIDKEPLRRGHFAEYLVGGNEMISRSKSTSASSGTNADVRTLMANAEVSSAPVRRVRDLIHKLSADFLR
jgi:hypothetical protein